ncbi:hypothetical protein [Piscinibacterium candidicorallinum]|uniref:Uncharacterized protein n=1 Tax=Piscinibacterium candidicorallinum TaxID=1793872 RepID=A0ABV7H305_9BURK
MRALWATCIGLVGLAGCTVYDGQFAWTDGWKRVRIVEILPPSEISRPGTPDCRNAPEAATTSLFAVVDVPTAGRVRRATIGVPEGFKYDPQKTYIANLWTCRPTLRESNGNSPGGGSAGAIQRAA